MDLPSLVAVAEKLVAPGKGLLASDESTGTIGKRFAKAGLENDEETRRSYRELFYTAPIGPYVSGIIMYKETLGQSATDGRRFVDVLAAQGILSGIKVDEGLQPLEGGLEGETHTLGLETLPDACAGYYAAGARFAKWRATLKIQAGGPSQTALQVNADELAQYAAVCQRHGLVPVVEPEILIDGDFDQRRCGEVTERVVSAVVAQLWQHNVALEALLLKPQMVVAGADCKGPKPSAADVAHATLASLRRVVPPAVPGVVFLSGGQGEEEATINLNAINVAAAEMPRSCPWALTFSFGRALQGSVLKAWSTDRSAAPDAQRLATALAAANSAASLGRYEGPHPSCLVAADGSLREAFRGWSGQPAL